MILRTLNLTFAMKFLNEERDFYENKLELFKFDMRKAKNLLIRIG
jgi:hypothetical protein